MKRDVFSILTRKTKREEINNFLPPKFSFFLKEYSLGEAFYYKDYFLFDKNLILLNSISFQKRLEDNIYTNTISNFLDLSQIKKDYLTYLESETKQGFYEGFLSIGHFSKADTIILGIDNSNKDEIWIIAGDLGFERPDILKIADDIYDFFDNCFEEIINLNLEIKGLNTSQLYRNWGEDFWRVREENS
jgi:hypothetical protein